MPFVFINDEKVYNFNIKSGDWRPIDLELDPFNFPAPIKIINEGCQSTSTRNGQKVFFSNKSLALWKIEDIPLT